MPRISKEPEIRRQEILQTALAVFSEKGYEQTKMADIAARLGIAQGLCYRYFPSKEALLDTAVEQYARLQTGPMITLMRDERFSLRQKISRMPGFWQMEQEDSAYQEAFHTPHSKKIHDQLALKICEIMQPVVAEAIQSAAAKGETSITDYATAASFGVYGQLGILLDQSLTGPEKIERLRSFLLAFLKL